MRKTTRDLVRAVQAEIKVNQAAIEPMLAARPEPEFGNAEVRYIQAAQNALRTCIEATLKQAGPYTDLTCIELAIRLASYAVSALPVERQHAALDMVIATLPAAHKARLEKGVVIKTEWMTDGVAHANIPAGRA